MNFFSRLFKKSQNLDSSDELRILQKKLNVDALAIAKTYKIKLDYSDKSIEQVEAILADFHDQFIQSKDDSGLRGIALIFGVYIISVIEKNHGKGVLERDHNIFGENSFPFVWKKSTLFPFAWCAKRIFDGPGDNVLIKYQQLVLK